MRLNYIFFNSKIVLTSLFLYMANIWPAIVHSLWSTFFTWLTFHDIFSACIRSRPISLTHHQTFTPNMSKYLCTLSESREYEISDEQKSCKIWCRLVIPFRVGISSRRKTIWWSEIHLYWRQRIAPHKIRNFGCHRAW